MIVMKFGGTSVEDCESIRRVVDIIKGRMKLKPVIVVSAMGKSTSKLLQAVSALAGGNCKESFSILADLKQYHVNEARLLIKNTVERRAFRLIKEYFDDLQRLLGGLSLLGEIPPSRLDKILSYGELLSSAIVADALIDAGIRARLLDSRDFIKTDNCFGAASPIFELTNSRIREVLTPIIENKEVPVIQGFISSTCDGLTTTLGLQGSDYTAGIVGAALGADDIQIWTDVSGLMTADPAIYEGARTVKACTFAEVAELTHFGASLLHPKAIHPAAEENIAVHIYNSRRPDAVGTAITSKLAKCLNPIKSIAYERSVSIMSIGKKATNGSGADSLEHLLKALDEGLGRWHVASLFTAVLATSIVIAFEATALNCDGGRALIDDMSKLGRVRVEADKAVVTLVGEGLRSDMTMASRLVRTLDKIGLEVMLHALSPITINLIVNKRTVETVIARLHAELFEKVDVHAFV
jgi:aspartate kinase